MALCGGMDRGEGGEKEGGVEVDEEGAINFATDEGHRGAEVLQRSWELFLSYAYIHPCIISVFQVKLKCSLFNIPADLLQKQNF